MRFINCGKFTSRGDWIHPTVTLDNTELIIVNDGCFDMLDGDKTYSLEPGCAIFLDEGKRHSGIETVHERVEFYWLHFKLDRPIKAKHLIMREPYPVLLLCRQILHYTSGGFPSEIAEHLMCVLIAEIESQAAVSSDNEPGLVEKLTEWVRINADRPLEVSDVTARFPYNEDYLSRLLRKSSGKGLKQLINEKRMNHLKTQLLKTELTLTEIADNAGFSDCKLFLKYFTYHEGVTPTEFRRMYRSGHTNNR